MKKASFFRLIALLAFFSLNFVQVSLSAQNTWGVRVGTQFCSFRSTSKDLEGMQKPSPKLLVAVPLTFGVSDNFAVQIEPSFVQKGTKIVFNGTESGVAYSGVITSTLNYLELPMLARFNFGRPTARFGIVVGPTVGYGLSGKNKTVITVKDKVTTNSENVGFGKDSYQRTDIGLAIGFGVQLANGLGLDVRYARGMKNLAAKEPTQTEKFYNNGVQLAMSYVLPMGGH